MIYKQSAAALWLLSVLYKETSAFAPTFTKTPRTYLGMQTTRPDKEAKSEDKGVIPNITTGIIFEEMNDIEGIPDPDDSHVEPEIPFFANEVAVKKVVGIVNVKDRVIPPEKIFDFGATVDLLIGKAFDTVEDTALMLKRSMKESDSLRHLDDLNADALSEWNDQKQAHKPRVLVIGTGWASHAFIKSIDTEKFRVLVVSPSNYFIFTPMLASTSVGTTEIRSIIESTRDANPTVKYLEGKGLDINTEAKSMTIKLGEGNIIDDGPDNKDQEVIEIPYDVVIYSAGVGPISSSKRTPGLSTENVHFLKTIDDAVRLRSSVITLLEKASQPGLTDEERRKILTFVVVGGGPTGVEYCGELTDFLNDVTGRGKKKNRPVAKRTVAPFAHLAKYTSVKLIQGGEELLPMFDKDLRDSAEKGLLNKRVDVRTNTRVSRIEGKHKIVTLNNDEIEEAIDCGIIVWAAGTMPVRLTERIIDNLDKACEKKGSNVTPGSLSKYGRIPVDRWQRVLGAPSGSMIAIGDASGTIGEKTDELLPQTAQVAAQQGAYVARLLNRGYDLTGAPTFKDSEVTTSLSTNSLFLPAPINHEAAIDEGKKKDLRGMVNAKPFKFLNLGQLAYTGGGEALSQVQLGDKKLFNQAGSVGFLLWRSVYIVKQVSTKTRLLVLLDWAKTRMFGRDVTRM
jgi:NADH dehydrogenase FAD-containing subunit